MQRPKINIFEHVNILLFTLWENPTFVSSIRIIHIYIYINLSRLRHVYVTPRSSIDFVPRLTSGSLHNSGFRSNSSPKRLHQSPTIFLFFFTLLSLTLLAFSHLRSVTSIQFLISAAKRF